MTRFTWSLALVLFFALSMPPMVNGLEPDLDSLVGAHEQLFSRIRTIELKLELERRVVTNGVPAKTAQKVLTLSWAKDRSKERIKCQDFLIPSTPNGLGRGLLDSINDGSTTRLLHNWDPVKPQKITPFNKGTVLGEIKPQSRTSMEYDPGRFLIGSFVFNFDGERLALSQLIKESSRAECLGRVLVGNCQTWQLRAYRPSRGVGTQKVEFIETVDVFLDPAANFAARKVVEVIRALDGSTYQFTREVEHFEEIKPDIYVPTRLNNQLEMKNGISQTEQVVVRDLRVNEPLSADAFDFKFPEHCHVANLPPVNGKIRVDIWGPDDKPRYTITSMEDLKKIPGYEAANLKPMTGRGGIRGRNAFDKGWRATAIGIPIAMIIVLVWSRRRRPRSQTKR